MQKKKKWEIFPQNRELAEKISSCLGISNVTSQILINRGITTEKSAKYFLEAKFDSLALPNEFEEINKAVEIIKQAIKSQKNILVFGDYDVDGMTATAILFLVLKSLSAKVNFFIPERNNGYGLSLNTISSAKNHNFQLIITVDCGIKSIDEINYANKLNIDVIVTDHHLPGKILPLAKNIINPHCNISNYYKNLSGAGVSFLLSWALLKEYKKEEEILNYLDLVCLGTVADIVPLLNENRILVKEGLKSIINTKRVGIKALLEAAGLSEYSKISSDFHLSFLIIPRLNAAGRMWRSIYGLTLLLSEDENKAKELVRILNEKNIKRQNYQNQIVEEAKEQIDKDENLQKMKVIVLYNKNWHSGVIGISASKIVDLFNKPTILFTSIKEGIAKGSCRSIDKFDITSSLSKCSNLLLSYGGHKKAAGLSLEIDKIEDFKMNINKIADEILTEDDLIKKIIIDAEVDFKDISEKLVDEINLLEPYGEGNQKPLLMAKKVYLENIILAGDKHIKMYLRQDNIILDAIWFDAKENLETLKNNTTMDIVFTPTYNNWGNNKNIQLIIEEIKIT